jgi:hypothetical protein
MTQVSLVCSGVTKAICRAIGNCKGYSPEYARQTRPFDMIANFEV